METDGPNDTTGLAMKLAWRDSRRLIPLLPQGEARVWFYRSFFSVYILETYISSSFNLSNASLPFEAGAILAPIVFVAAKVLFLQFTNIVAAPALDADEKDLLCATMMVWLFGSIFLCISIWLGARYGDNGDLVSLQLRKMVNWNIPAFCEWVSGTPPVPPTMACLDELGWFPFLLSLAITSAAGAVLAILVGKWKKWGGERPETMWQGGWGVAWLIYFGVASAHAFLIRWDGNFTFPW